MCGSFLHEAIVGLVLNKGWAKEYDIIKPSPEGATQLVQQTFRFARVGWVHLYLFTRVYLRVCVTCLVLDIYQLPLHDVKLCVTYAEDVAFHIS